MDDAQVAAYEEFLFVPIDPNAVDSATLQQIPGVGEALVQCGANNWADRGTPTAGRNRLIIYASVY